MAHGLISDDDVNKVRTATDLVALVGERVPVKPKGREFWCCCPLHQEKTPSFKIDPSTQLWHCFGCGEGGDAFGFVMKADDLSFPEAVRKLAERAHIELADDGRAGTSSSKKRRLKDVCRAAAEFFHLQLMRGKDPGATEARRYLAERGLGGAIPKEWQLGYAPGHGALVAHLRAQGFAPDELVQANVATFGKNGRLLDRFYGRVMFPISDVHGDVIAFGGRVIGEGNPKYLNTQETPIFHKGQVLYALDAAKAQMTATGTAIVTEGYTDVIAMHQAGLRNAVATLGTALTRNHIRLLARHAGKRIVYIFDGDAAGQRATERALQFIDESVTPESGAKQLDICALCLPDGQDPADYLATHSPEEMSDLIRHAQPLVLFGIERRMARHDRGTAEGRAAALADALDVLAPIKDSILAKDYAVQIAGMLRFREEDVLDQLGRVKKPRRWGEDAASGEPGAPTLATAPERQHASEAAAQTPRISLAERNRLALEREYLAAIACSPVDFIAHAERLMQVKWHDRTHLVIAEAIMQALMEKLDSSPAELVERVAQTCAKAPSILTGQRSYGNAAPADVLRFLSEELAIGDVEEELASMRMTARADGDADAFSLMVALQERLSEMKNAHRPLS